MRKKTVSIDGAEFHISSLTVDQVEEIIAPIEELDLKSGKARVYQIICHGINNYIQDQKTGEELWTPENIGSKLDLVSLPFLKSEILKFSGLNEEEAKKPEGETLAVQETSTSE